MILPAYAKLNLTLDVLGRRPDGYHEIASVMQTISLHDLLWVEPSDCKTFEGSGLEVEGDNLVLKAARELEAQLGKELGFRIRLHKRIPIGAGLGGGSSDAAAFLRAATLIYGLPLGPADLVDVATRVGQDVPFFLKGGTALATGLGSTLEPLPPLTPSLAFLVVCPPVAISTRRVYEAIDSAFPSGKKTNGLAASLRSGAGVSMADFGNDLEAAVQKLYPALGQSIQPLRDILPELRMTGTGAAFFDAFSSESELRLALKRLSQRGIAVSRAQPVSAWA